MNTVVPLKANVDWTGKQLQLIRHTVARDCNDTEFDLFIHTARAVGLDPLRKQIYAQVYSKDNPAKRQLTIITAIGGYRSIAERTSNYRPDDRAPRYTMCDPSPINPIGIERCEVTVYKFSHGEWHPVIGEAWWAEYVPTWDGKIDTRKGGWSKMPRIMLSKVAEAAALRKAWPDDFGDLKVEEEMDRAHVLDLTATEIVQQHEAEQKLDLMGGKNALTVDWGGGNPLERVPEGQFIDKALKWIAQPHITREDAAHWWKRNEVTRAEYKARHGGEYLEFQKAWERLLGTLPSDVSQEPVESAQDAKERAVLDRLKERLAQCASLADVEQLEADAASTIAKLSSLRQQEAKSLIEKAKGNA